MSEDNLKEIIDAFLRRNAKVLTDQELSATIVQAGRTCSIEEIHQTVQRIGSSLFQRSCDKDGTYFIRIEPKISLCQNFLRGKCTVESCDQLHLCPNFIRCRKRNCRFPHSINVGNNQRVIQQANCENIDPLKLISILQLSRRSSPRTFKNSSAIHPTTSASVQQVPERSQRRTRRRGGRGRGRQQRSQVSTCHNDADQTVVNLSSTVILNSNCQVDISVSSKSGVSSITIEEILKTKGFPVQMISNPKQDEDVCQWTFHLADSNAVNELLKRNRALVHGEDFDLKLRRTHQIMDSKSFVLQVSIDMGKGPIAQEEFLNYIDILTDHHLYQYTDLSTASEQFLLIECYQTIDFERLGRIHNSRRQLQGRDVSWKQIYEIDTVMIESIRMSLSSAVIQKIFEPIREDIFAWNATSERTIIIEFVHVDALRQWLLNRDRIKEMFDVNIQLKIESNAADDQKSTVSNPSSATSVIESKVEKMTSRVTINLRQSWTIVAGHPKFGAEYKDYILSETGLIINIHGNRIQSNPTDQQASFLNFKTNEFMKNFYFRSIPLQKPAEQLATLRAHSSIIAFGQTRRNTYLLATKKTHIDQLMQILGLGESFGNKPQAPLSARSTATQQIPKAVDRKQVSSATASSMPIPVTSTADRTTINQQMTTRNTTIVVDTPAKTALFSDTTFLDCLRSHVDQTFHVKMNIELVTDDDPYCTVKLVGSSQSVNKTSVELSALMNLFCTKILTESTKDHYPKIIDAHRVIQHQLNLRQIICVCQRETSPVCILIHYISKEHEQLGADEEIIEIVCRNQLVVSTFKLTIVGNEWLALKNNVLRRDDYGKDICFAEQQQTITLYGVPHVVRDIQQQFETMNRKETTNVPLIHALATPSQSVEPKPVMQSILFDIDEPGFEVIVGQNSNCLSKIVAEKCSLKIQIIQQSIRIKVPKAKARVIVDSTPPVASPKTAATQPDDKPNNDLTKSNSNWLVRLFQRKQTQPTRPSPSTASAVPTPSVTVTLSTFITVGPSKIIIRTGDLTKEAVDSIVVCSTSTYLCKAIVSAAGFGVENVYKQNSSNGVQDFETIGGNLPCKRIIFRPWAPNSKQPEVLKQTIDVFIASVITYAAQQYLTSIAFPSIGCGQLGNDPKLIAQYMIGETYRQLKTCVKSSLTVSFVLMPDQKDVYNAFVDRLNLMKNDDNDDAPTDINFDKQTVRIKLTSTDVDVLAEYQKKVKRFAQSCSFKLQLTDQTDLADWPQTTIQAYYDYCLQKRVLPTLDINKLTIDLIGLKDAVSEAEKYYFKLTTDLLRQARIQLVTCEYIWSVEISSGQWNQYSNKNIELIENAYMKKLAHVDIINEKSEQCRVIFATMEEQYQQRKRAVSRKKIGSALPNHWDSSGGNLKRITLVNSSQEYKDVLNRFDKTMIGEYRRVIRIERIQNERWYKQYAAHRDDFIQRHRQPDERLLFHGCAKASADKIIDGCFNRSFAGVNGTSYGGGVYFHEHAKYSHSYTRSDSFSERTMFLARVLVGKTCLGNTSMKVPPEGYDTTTDGKHIFVVYHDAAAYGEYLIIYQ